ncbi:RNA polymerase sigma-70 factor [Carboxylicivirga sediminis]|uniref:RNA polymerase sigma-70 factor n=1 Tax=Carboxylicivirga sediminis TaxID=2006564 RepID=A0A941F268_9BACT|nr:RNA polymerase sigma-70 factor [Carboxylicivirga sediminis]MBR8534773.1 RNA polymerase sigma-70 factor [Carboxylicivirga sediminis]
MDQSGENINLSLIQNGNHFEFARLMDRYSDALYLFAKGILASSPLAEEVVSDIFVKVWQTRHQLDKVANIKSYLFNAVRNQAITYLRKQHQEVVSIEDINHYYFEPIDTPDESALKEEQLRRIYKAIDYLAPQTKMVFSLAKIQGLKYKEIAELLNISVKTVDYHVASAVKKICESIDKEEGGNGLNTLRIFLAISGC